MTVNGEIQRRLRTYEHPRWGYRRGESGEVEKELFDRDLPDGWSDSPAHVDQPDDGKIVDPAAADTPPAPENPPDVLAPPYDRYGFHRLRLELQRRTGKGPVPGTTTEALIALLEETDRP